MEDITHLLHRYRECARVLWNNSLREDADYRTVDTYAQVKVLLFDEIVLAAIGKAGYARLASDDPYPFLKVVPRGDGVPIMINRPSATGGWTWDDPVDRLGREEADLRLMEYFDFEQMGYLDLQYYRARIITFPKHRGLEGREALLEVQYARVFLEDLPMRPPNETGTRGGT